MYVCTHIFIRTRCYQVLARHEDVEEDALRHGRWVELLVGGGIGGGGGGLGEQHDGELMWVCVCVWVRERVSGWVDWVGLLCHERVACGPYVCVCVCACVMCVCAWIIFACESGVYVCVCGCVCVCICIYTRNEDYVWVRLTCLEVYFDSLLAMQYLCTCICCVYFVSLYCGYISTLNRDGKKNIYIYRYFYLCTVYIWWSFLICYWRDEMSVHVLMLCILTWVYYKRDGKKNIYLYMYTMYVWWSLLTRYCRDEIDRKKPPPPGGVSYLLCSLIKNRV